MESASWSTLGRLEYGPARHFRGLTVLPMVTPDACSPQPEYVMLDQALKDGSCRIGEVSAEGHVPELLLTNDGERPVFLLDGEEVLGAKQNRIVNLSILAPGRS